MPKRVATTVERRYLPSRKCKKIVKQDTNWNDMPNEMKAMIMNSMDVVTRTRLTMCSKSDKSLSEKFPILVPVISADANYHGDKEFSLTDPSYDWPIRKFRISQFGKRVGIIKEGKRCKEFWLKDQKEAVELIEKFYHSVLLAKHIRFGCIETNWHLTESYIPNGHIFHFDTVNLVKLLSTSRFNWLNNIAPEVDKVFCRNDDIGGIAEFPFVLNAKDVNMDFTDINDDQLVNLKATNIRIYFSKVTEVGARNLMKKWIDKDYPIGSKFEISFKHYESIPTTPTIDKFFDGIQVYRKTTTTNGTIHMRSRKVMRIEIESDEGSKKIQAEIVSF